MSISNTSEYVARLLDSSINSTGLSDTFVPERLVDVFCKLYETILDTIENLQKDNMVGVMRSHNIATDYHDDGDEYVRNDARIYSIVDDQKHFLTFEYAAGSKIRISATPISMTGPTGFTISLEVTTIQPSMFAGMTRPPQISDITYSTTAHAPFPKLYRILRDTVQHSMESIESINQ